MDSIGGTERVRGVLWKENYLKFCMLWPLIE